MRSARRRPQRPRRSRSPDREIRRLRRGGSELVIFRVKAPVGLA
jgi:hypothetical protein